MNEIEETLFDIVRHVEEHGNFLINKDSPLNLKIGWQCTKTDKIWTINLIKTKHLKSDDVFFNTLFKEYVYSSEGRLKLITIIKNLDKYKKLKAFW